MGNDLLTSRLEKDLLIFDGATGTELYRKNFFVNVCFENLVLTSPDTVQSIHQSYIDSGCDVITTNTFSANANKLSRFGLVDKLEDICENAVKLARKCAHSDTLIAGSVGPAGELTEAYKHSSRAELIAVPAKAIAHAGADFIIFESLDSIEDVLAVAMAAPELEGGMEFGRALRAAGITGCMGHSNATLAEVEEAMGEGSPEPYTLGYPLSPSPQQRLPPGSLRCSVGRGHVPESVAQLRADQQPDSFSNILIVKAAALSC